MFEKDYNRAMDNIKPQTETKDKILNNIILKEEVKQRKNPAIAWRVAFACVTCIAIVLGVLFVPKNNVIKDNTKNKNTSTNKGNPSDVLMISKSYDEIYKLLNHKKVVLWDESYVMYETDMEEIATEGTSSSNQNAMEGDAAAKPGASKGEIDSDDVTNNTDKGEDYSNTTEQVEGVSEADIVKTDGKYIYYLVGNELFIYKAEGEKSSLVSRTMLERQQNENYGDMFLKGDRLILLQPNDYICEANYVTVIIYDISNPAEPKRLSKASQEGWYNSSRMVGDYVYLISNCHINTTAMDKDDPTTFVPTTEINGVCEAVPADSIYRYEKETYEKQYTVIGAFNYKDGTMSDTASILGGTDNIYCSQGNIVLAETEYNNEKIKDDESYNVMNTLVTTLAISEGNIEYKNSGKVEGTLNNQFYIDEYNGYFRFVTTVTKGIQKTYKFDNNESDVVSYTQETSAKLTILDGELKKVGEINDLAKGERVYSVRFMGDVAYFVTFRQTDPLFSADLSDPKNPKILGELKIPGFSEYMYPYGDGKLLGFGMDANELTGRTTYLKLSMFDITNPADVTEQNKTIIDGYNYSTALDNHKSMLVSPGKNLIGFVAHDSRGFQKYMVYEYTGEAFNLKAQITPPYENEADYWKYWDATRGLFINDNFYLASDKGLQVFDIATFTPLCTVKIK